MRKPMTLGGFAKASGVGVETVRYYQRRGLLTTPPRAPGSRRAYSQTMLARMSFIRRAQSLGFTLEEIERALSLSEKDCASGRQLAEDKLHELDRKAAEMNRMRRELRAVVRKCSDRRPGAPCPFLRMLSEAQTPEP